MCEKRFTLAYADYDWWAICDKENPTELGISGLDVVELLNELYEENQQLQERNNRQAKQLDNLYTLIEKQNWKTLKGIIQEFQECEEQLQRESGTYGDLK